MFCVIKGLLLEVCFRICCSVQKNPNGYKAKGGSKGVMLAGGCCFIKRAGEGGEFRFLRAGGCCIVSEPVRGLFFEPVAHQATSPSTP
jgi:hypothetical protein